MPMTLCLVAIQTTLIILNCNEYRWLTKYVIHIGNTKIPGRLFLCFACWVEVVFGLASPRQFKSIFTFQLLQEHTSEHAIAWTFDSMKSTYCHTHTTLYHKICTAYLHCMAQHLDSCRHTFRPSRQRQAAMKFYLWLVNFPDVSKMAYRTVNRFADEDGVATTARFYGVLMRWWCRMRCTQGPTIHRWRCQSIMLVKFRTEQWSLA